MTRPRVHQKPEPGAELFLEPADLDLKTIHRNNMLNGIHLQWFESISSFLFVLAALTLKMYLFYLLAEHKLTFNIE